MLKLIKKFYELGNEAVAKYADIDEITAIEAKEKIGRAKYIEESSIAQFDEIEAELESEMNALCEKGDSDV